MYTEIDRIRSALTYIPSDDRDLWVRIGMAIKSELGEGGHEIWDEWSRGADSYQSRAAKDTWKSCSSHGSVTIGTLFYEAKQRGWREDESYSKPSPEDLERRRSEQRKRAQAEELRAMSQRNETRRLAEAFIAAANPVSSDHPYLLRKEVQPTGELYEIHADQGPKILGFSPIAGVEQLQGRLLVVPVKKRKSLSTLELIDESGRKTALPGQGTKTEAYWATGSLPDKLDQLLIGEGVATVISASMATNVDAVAALSSCNLRSVAAYMRERYPTAWITILADIDKKTREPDKNACVAAAEIGAQLAVPEFGISSDPTQTDFNDMHLSQGLDAVKGRILSAPLAASAESQEEVAEPADAWPEPEPLVQDVQAEPYPLDALPSDIRAAVEEVASFVQAPIPLVANSALAALSLAGQAYINVTRARRLSGPVGLFILTIAESGERKSTCDGFFTAAIQKYQDKMVQEMRPIVEKYEGELAAWAAKEDGIKAAIKDAAKKGNSTAVLTADLVRHQKEKPLAPRVPRILLADETPESLAWSLATIWPAAGLVSSEAGAIFGSHAMSKDNVMKNLALQNTLWDGKEHTVGRRGSANFTVRGARLTAALQVQEAPFREFLEKTGTLARGIGFLARFFVAWPESTQGTRLFSEAPVTWPKLDRFSQRIEEILSDFPAISEEGALLPNTIGLTPGAKSVWVAYHDEIEKLLGSGGELTDIRDVASKSADNVARLAALFQLFQSGSDSEVTTQNMQHAARVGAWYLQQSLIFCNKIAMPADVLEVSKLDAWILKQCQEMGSDRIEKTFVRQRGPIRDSKRLGAAIEKLHMLSRLRIELEGQKAVIHINPSLIGEAA